MSNIFHRKDEVLYEKKDFPSEVIAFVWQNIWEWGVANRAYKLANSDYKVSVSYTAYSKQYLWSCVTW